ncbi:MAG: hypothetical protein GWN71_33015, partial [Gammaproteobacteria bacterium]|nr:hypothetical protein [Gammaproteobacteria bacterium]
MTAPDTVRARLQQLVEHAGLGGVRGIEPLTGGLATRSFFRVTLENAAPASLIARVDAEEDPA